MPMIELLTVANHAEAINGLLYVSGAGWTNLRRAMPPEGPAPINHIGIAIAVLVGWNETNQRHRINVRLEDADAREIVNMNADLEMGRPPGLLQGSDLRGVIAINAELQFPAAGVYRVVAAIAEDQRSVTFRVHDVPAAPRPAAPPQP